VFQSLGFLFGACAWLVEPQPVEETFDPMLALAPWGSLPVAPSIRQSCDLYKHPFGNTFCTSSDVCKQAKGGCWREDSAGTRDIYKSPYGPAPNPIGAVLTTDLV